MIKVKNKDRAINASEYYYYIQSPTGTDYLFTENHVEQAIERAKKNQEDIPSHYDDGFSRTFTLGVFVGVITAFVGLAVYQQWLA